MKAMRPSTIIAIGAASLALTMAVLVAARAQGMWGPGKTAVNGGSSAGKWVRVVQSEIS